MGMYDSVWFACKKDDCEGRVEVQSKIGECTLADYEEGVNTVPAGIAEDINGQTISCRECGELYSVHAHLTTNVWIS